MDGAERGRRSKYLTRRVRNDPVFVRLREEFDAWTITSPDAKQLALRWAVRLYDEAVQARVRHGERIRDVVQRVATAETVSAVGDVGLALEAARAKGDLLPVPVWGALYADACQEEARAAALLELAVGRHIAWPWLSSIDGIGPILAGRLLSRLDIRRAPTPASFWAYCGLATVPGVLYRCSHCEKHIAGPVGLRETPLHRRSAALMCEATVADPMFGADVRVAQTRPKRGESRGYDVNARHACYLIGVSFVRRGTTYKVLYAEQRQRIVQRHSEWPPKRIQLAAQRATVKRFLADLWLEWRNLTSLPIVPARVERHLSSHEDGEVTRNTWH